MNTPGQPERVVQATGAEWVLGRDPGCDLVIDDERVSRRHATLRVAADGTAELRDLGSANGTRVNGRAVATDPVLLRGGDDIQVGSTRLRSSLRAPGAVQVPDENATRVGEPTPDFAPPRPSVIERQRLSRSVRTATVVGVAAIASVLTLVVLFATGVLGGGGGGGKTVPQIVAQATPSTVRVLAVNGSRGASGTGWVLDAAAGLIVTNQHVVNDGQSFQVQVNGAGREAHVMGSAPCDDVAVLRVDDTASLKTLPLGSQSDLKAGDSVVALGYPGSDSSVDQLTATTGVVSVVSTSFDQPNAMDVPNYPDIVQHTAAINPGNSGGPLVDMHGRLVGMNSAATTLRDNRVIQEQNYAVGVDRIKQVVPALRAGHSDHWMGLGWEYEPDGSAVGMTQPGLLVRNVVPGSPAATAGFPVPAYITAVNGQQLDGTLQSYCSAVRSGPAEAAALTFVRDGASTTENLTVPYATAAP
ncbi:MAG: trypsin-like peptidase domain-containing protein [Thermoleophilia bacterium]